VAADLRQDWPKALHEAGFDPTEPTAWAAEGLLPYLPADGQDLLFERIHQYSARDSRIAVESFGAGFFDPDYLASRREQLREMKEAAGAEVDDAPDVEDLWFVEERPDVGDWLSEHGWEVTSFEAAGLMTRYGRSPLDAGAATPRTVFVEGKRT
jgi:methyltransferase (TIGR00027 family)